MNNAVFNEEFRRRTKQFSLDIIQVCDGLSNTQVNRVILYQLCKAGTSVGANFRAFCRGRSRAERYAKICIVVEEADECEYWLEIIWESGKNQSDKLQKLLTEITEIIKITARIKSAFAPS